MAGAVADVKEKSEIAPEREAAAAATEATAIELVEKVDGLSLEEKLEAESGEAYIKHPLQNSWTLWFLHPDAQRNWDDRVIPILSFDTVEDFWSIYNHIKTPAEFNSGHDYYLFKQGIKPTWEHEANSKGGKLEITWERRANKPTDVDKLWLDTMLLLIGEAFEETDLINGVVVNIRKMEKISLWLATKDNRDSIKSIATRWRSHLSWQRKIQFHSHEGKAKPIEY